MRQAKVNIDQNALTYNLNYVKKLAPKAKIISMVKANAYGHGIKNCLPALIESDGFGVACLDEAIEIRKLGYKHPITLIEGVFDEEELLTAISYQCECLVHQKQQIQWLIIHKDLYQKSNLKVWVKLNCGMNRLGFKPNEIIEIIEQLKSEGFTCVLTMHFANADIDHSMNEEQKNKFLEIKEACSPILCSCCNSAAIIKWPELHFDYIRPGIMLYGVSPITNQKTNLKPAMSFTATIIALNDIKPQEKVGYGSTFIAARKMTIAVIGIGYGDGYPRNYSTQNFVFINNQLAPLVGRVSMDMMTIDVTDLNCSIGDQVELWGKHRLVDDVAHCNNTIGYELLCRLSNRPHRTIN